jgi:hypothetical protein
MLNYGCRMIGESAAHFQHSQMIRGFTIFGMFLTVESDWIETITQNG